MNVSPRALAAYALAVSTYDAFVLHYANDPEAYEFRYNRADALYWSGYYLEAAQGYASVRDSQADDRYRTATAYMAVLALEAHLRREAAQGRVDPCTLVRGGMDATRLVDPATQRPLLSYDAANACRSAPVAVGSPPAVPRLPLPDAVRTLMDARAAYAQRVPRAQDHCAALRDVYNCEGRPEVDPPYGPVYHFLDAATLERHGHLAEAEARYRQVLWANCQNGVVARAAFMQLDGLLRLAGRDADREALLTQARRANCVF